MENCRVSDEHMGQILEILGQSSKLREIHLVKMKLEPAATKAILLLLKNTAGTRSSH